MCYSCEGEETSDEVVDHCHLCCCWAGRAYCFDGRCGSEVCKRGEERGGERTREIEEGNGEEDSIIILYQVVDEMGDIQEEERSFLSDATLRLE